MMSDESFFIASLLVGYAHIRLCWQDGFWLFVQSQNTDDQVSVFAECIKATRLEY